MLTDGAVRQFSGREFQSLGAATEKRLNHTHRIMNTSVANFTEIRPLCKEILRHVKYARQTDGRRTDEQPVSNILPPPMLAKE